MRKLLVLLAVGWIGVNLAAARLAYDRRLPYDLDVLDRSGTSGRIAEDWLLGWGTGLAVPLWFIALGAVLTVLSTLGGSAGRGGSLLLTGVGAASVAFSFLSRHATDLLANPAADPTGAGLVIASVVLAALIVLIGFAAFVASPRERLR